MQLRKLGTSALLVSPVGLGCNNFGLKLNQDETNTVVAAALDYGINFFDTADVYAGEKGNSEELLGKALGSRRQDVIVATKFGGAMNGPAPKGGGSAAYIMGAVENSLNRLGTDYIDLYQFHQPDPDTPIDETLATLDQLVKSGKVRAIGASNFSGGQIAEAHAAAERQDLAPFVSVQNRYSLITRGIEDEVVPQCLKFGMSVLPFFPLESGLLTGKYRIGGQAPKNSRFDLWGELIGSTFMTDRNLEIVEAFREICRQHDQDMTTAAIGWLCQQPFVASVIAGATTVEQIAQNVEAAVWRPDEGLMAKLDGLLQAP